MTTTVSLTPASTSSAVSLVATARVTAADVQTIIDTNLTTAQINAFINAANAIIQDNLLDAGLGTTTLAQIELWLAAHLLAIRDQRERSVTISDGKVDYHQPQFGLGLDATMYGQQVKLLDWSGRLAALGQKRAVIEVY